MADAYTVERSLHVDAPPSAVHDRVVDLRRWREWSPWEGLDDDMQREYGGTADGGVGQTYAWSGNRRAGTGRMEVLEVEPDRLVRVALQFVKPFKSSSETSFTFEPSGDGTDVRWSMEGPHSLMSRVMGLFVPMDRMVGPDFERGLDQLRRLAEGH